MPQPHSTSSSGLPRASASMSIGHRPPRSRIKPRPRAGWLQCVLLSLLFAAAAAPIASADKLFFGSTPIVSSEPAPVTVRAPRFAGFRSGDVRLGGGVVVARGEVAGDADRARLATELLAGDATRSLATFAGGMFILALFLTTGLRSGHRGKLVRSQLVILGLLLFGLAAIKAAVLFTAVSVLAVPVALFALLARSAIDRPSGLATGLASGFAVAVLVPFDPGVTAVLLAQAVTPVIVLGSGEITRRRLLFAGLAGGVAAALAYLAYALLSWGLLPPVDPDRLLTSGVVTAAVGGVAAGPLAMLVLPAVQAVLGDVTRNRLVELEDFSNPLLQQIAERSPGTWQHSLAMANMAETAANAIGANGRLVRVGAYYHDLGKSIQPKYFIENLTPGEPSPHDSLEPDVSAGVIFAHVTEGVRLGRSRGLPDRIIDFMHMHHGDGLLEYFWAKCQEQGNPDGLDESDFRYPGLRPQSKETAILAITDAVEAASRTLRKADDKSIRNLVQRIVYGKLHLGQLDESGLTMSDLRRISEALQATIKHAHHGRIEYPWQREERGEGSAEAATVALRKPGRAPPAPPRPGPGDSGRITTNDVRLDSLDAPRPGWRQRARTEAGARNGRAPEPRDPAPAIDPQAETEAARRAEPAAPEPEPAAPEPEPSPAATAPGYRSGLDDGTAASSEPPSAASYPGPITSVGVMPPAAPPRRPAPESIPIAADDPSIVSEMPLPDEGADSKGDEPGDFEVTAALADNPGARKRPGPRTQRLAEWEQALEKAAPRRPARPTSELLRGAGDDSPLEDPLSAAASLGPGTLVFGPPPETHPGDRTVERKLPIPPEGIRPSKRRTRERRVMVPPEAFPEAAARSGDVDDTEPSTAGFLPGEDDE